MKKENKESIEETNNQWENPWSSNKPPFIHVTNQKFTKAQTMNEKNQ